MVSILCIGKHHRMTCGDKIPCSPQSFCGAVANAGQRHARPTRSRPGPLPLFRHSQRLSGSAVPTVFDPVMWALSGP